MQCLMLGSTSHADLQITAIILNPAFPGWLEPLHFNPGRFGELASFSTTLTVSWVLSSLLVGGYRSTASAGIPKAYFAFLILMTLEKLHLASRFDQL